jgi:hypothetical protein
MAFAGGFNQILLQSARSKRAPRLHGPVSRKAIKAWETGGADRDRTDDLVIANDALSQLSYCPTDTVFGGSGGACQASLSRPDLDVFTHKGRNVGRWARTGKTGNLAPPVI